MTVSQPRPRLVAVSEKTNHHVEFNWCDDLQCAEEVMDFFERNVTRDYISYGSVAPKILGCGPWSLNKAENVQALQKRIASEPSRPRINKNAHLIVVAKLDGELAGIMLVNFWADPSNPHVVLEDIVVDGNVRGLDIGRKMFEWVDTACSFLNYSWWLETSVTNVRAQKFFERLGFKARALIMERSSAF